MADVKAAASAPVPVDPAKLVRNRPTAPCLWFTGDEKGESILSLPLANLTITASFHVSTAIVKLSSTWVNTSGKTIDGLFSFPLKGTVTSSRVRVGQGRILETQVVALDEANKAQQTGGETKLNIPSGSVEAYVPDLFRLPVAAVPAGEHVKIDATFIEPLEYNNGRYHFSMPLRFPPGTLPIGLPVNQVVNISGTVDAFVPGIQVFSSSYGLLLTNYPGQISFKAQLPDPNAVEAVNFDVSYNLPSAQIMGTLIKEQDPAPRMMGEEGSFLLMVTPPAPDKVQGVFKRTFVFIIDRSGSMTGKPYEEACRALEAGLKTLRDGDAFTVVAFDGKFDSWTQDVVPVNAQNVQDGGNWARRNGPRGGTTEIQQPLNWALQLLSRYDKQSLCFCVLLTDGCVPNERDICQPLTLKEGNPLGNSRILTFGIGTYCNWYFLKMLATLGRGYSDVVVDTESIYPRVTKLVELCAFPVLTNVDVQVAGCDQIELYPMPLPDLFVGAPLLVAGKYRTGGRFPDRLTLSGNIADGRRLALEVLTMVNPLIPVNQVFVKQRLDLLTARAWLTQDKALEAEIVKLSVEQSMPCVYTTMVAYEVNDSRRAEIEAEEKKDAQAEADPNKPPAAAPPPAKKGASSATIAACAVGGVLVVGAAVGAAFAFGNVGATAGNLVAPVVGVLGHAGRAIAGFGGAAIGAAGKAIGAAGGAIGHAVSNCGHCECCSCFGNIFGHCGGCSGCGNCLHSVEGVCGHCCSNAFGCIGHGFSKLCGVCCACNCWGSIGSVLGGCFKPVFSCCGSVFGAVVGCCGKLCSENCLKSLTGCCSGIFGCCSKGCGSGFGAVTGFCSKTCWPCVQNICCFVCKQIFRK